MKRQQPLKVIGDFERISDYAVNIFESAEELRDKGSTLTEEALKEYDVISSAVVEVLDATMLAFRGEKSDVAMTVSYMLIEGTTSYKSHSSYARWKMYPSGRLYVVGYSDKS